MSITITIGREFGSGGREFGKALADELHFAYYDKEILEEVQKRTSYSLSYIEGVSENRPYSIPTISYGNSFMFYKDVPLEQHFDIHNAQADFLREVSDKGSCVIIGRAADYVLKDRDPFRIFVYATMEEKIRRCRQREQNEKITDRQLERQIKSIDKKRKNFYEFYTGKIWGDKENYQLMVNTTGADIPTLAKHIATMIQADSEKKD